MCSNIALLVHFGMAVRGGGRLKKVFSASSLLLLHFSEYCSSSNKIDRGYRAGLHLFHSFTSSLLCEKEK